MEGIFSLVRKYNIFDIVITILFVISNTILMLYEKSIYHPKYYVNILLIVCFIAFSSFQ